MCCPDADHKERRREKKPNPKAAGSGIMRLQLTVNFKTGMRRRSTSQEREREKYYGGMRRCISLRVQTIVSLYHVQTFEYCVGPKIN